MHGPLAKVPSPKETPQRPLLAFGDEKCKIAPVIPGASLDWAAHVATELVILQRRLHLFKPEASVIKTPSPR